MKKKIQRYLSGEREGFSLIELIIVIAIMAILIGVIALVVIPYLSSSKVSKDHDTLNQVATAFKSAVAIQKTKPDFVGKTFSEIKSDEKFGNLANKIEELMDGTVDDAKKGLASDAASGQDFYFTYDKKEGCYVTIGNPAKDDGEGGTFTTKAGAAS